jgi:hypothetical protein
LTTTRKAAKSEPKASGRELGLGLDMKIGTEHQKCSSTIVCFLARDFVYQSNKTEE